jgi:hypothetical protein
LNVGAQVGFGRAVDPLPASAFTLNPKEFPMTNNFSDSLDGIFGGSSAPEAAVVPVEPVARIVLTPELERAAEVGGHFERCPKCGGSGRFGRSGRCFACNGKGGKSFKSSSTDRAKARDQAADRKARRTAEDIQAFMTRHPEIHAWMIEAAPTFPFAQAMQDAVAKFGDLTERQLAACQRCVDARKARTAIRAEERAAREAAAPMLDVSRIEQAFVVARERAQRPGAMGIWTRPLKLTADGVTLSVQPGSLGSQWEGMLFVKDADGKKLGHVKDGKFKRRFECTDGEQAAVLQACSDPEQAAIAFGKAWSRCAVCNRELTNDGSIERGIGPICAERFGW